MKEDREQRHVCKFCKKDFPCGRSLGGHMRSHMRNIEKKDKLEKKKTSCSINGGSSSNTNNIYLVEFDVNGHVGYGLRENPKKTWRISDSIDDDGSLKQEKICKECGKEFQSWKALFGHMKCHSEKERVSDSLENDSWIMDSQSDTETAAPRRRRRSKRTRYKNYTTTSTTITASSSLSLANNGSSSVSEIEHEQEEVAMCLMMLSRDVGHWGGLTESSDNNSVVVEVKSSSLVKGISEKEDSNVNQIVKTKKLKDKKLKCVLLDSDNALFEPKGSEFGNSNYGMSRNGVKKLESAEDSVNGSIGECRFKKPKSDNEEGFEVSNAKLGKGVYTKSRVKCAEAELRKDLVKEGDDQTDSECGKYSSPGKRARRHNASDSKIVEECSKKMKFDATDSPSKSKYQCAACNKIFHSYQALGGHRASHKKIKGCCAPSTESSETIIELNADSKTDGKLMKSFNNGIPIEKEAASWTETSYGSKKNKHECPICSKVFTSGQALGGHKRSHVLEASEARGNHTIVIQQQLPEIRDFLDLNLPAPVEEDTSAHIGFKPWWAGNNHKHEQAVGLIFN
ncbi:hypothetical protein IFM89_008069 [Coptis chinensis]|uniref:C2H2-type domain-containing protein n=1 Tax=Coptis chinensis TaxID=261450 RepID=A0A835MHP4_9MAGN|nr:hypothetical protein IFM89_008069 [Coptis chinensis]